MLDSLNHAQKHFSVLPILYFAQGLHYQLVVSLILNHLQYNVILNLSVIQEHCVRTYYSFQVSNSQRN